MYQGEANTNIALESVVAVPLESWHEDLLRPQRVCTRMDGECIETHYPSPPESVKVLWMLLKNLSFEHSLYFF